MSFANGGGRGSSGSSGSLDDLRVVPSGMSSSSSSNSGFREAKREKPPDLTLAYNKLFQKGIAYLKMPAVRTSPSELIWA